MHADAAKRRQSRCQNGKQSENARVIPDNVCTRQHRSGSAGQDRADNGHRGRERRARRLDRRRVRASRDQPCRCEIGRKNIHDALERRLDDPSGQLAQTLKRFTSNGALCRRKRRKRVGQRDQKRSNEAHQHVDKQHGACVERSRARHAAGGAQRRRKDGQQERNECADAVERPCGKADHAPEPAGADRRQRQRAAELHGLCGKGRLKLRAERA